MENRRRVTEEDLLVTEALIAKSYTQLKQSVIEAPSRAYREVSQTVREHPVASTAAAVVAGVVIFGIIKKITAKPPIQKTQDNSGEPVQKNQNHPDPMHEILLMIIPMVTPYIAGYIQKYMGSILSEDMR
jgi:hypothetical protein